MSQSVSDIQAEMIVEKANHSELSPLNSTSNTSIWALWMFVTATIIVFFEQVMDLFKIDIQNIINSNQYGTSEWWQGKMLAFQYGDLLAFTNNVFQYPVVDTSAQIIQFCSITSLNGMVQIKVAGSSGGVPTALSNDQLNGAIAYASEIQPAGIRFAMLSLSADLLQLNANIYYDASGNITTIQNAVVAAINTFLTTNNTGNFNGTLYVNSLIAAISAVPGLMGNKVFINSISAKNGGSDYTNFAPIGYYQPESGYFMIDPAYPLSATLTYLPFVSN